MKRIVSFIIMCCLMFCIVPCVTAQDEYCTVMFRLPEGHFYTEVDSFGRVTYTQGRTLKVEKGHVLTEEDIEPFTHHCLSDDDYLNGYPIEYNPHRFCRVTQIGWDRDPVDGVPEENIVGTVVDKDMTFVAVMNEDVCTITVKANKGKFHIFREKYDSFTIQVDRGYTLNSTDARRITTVELHYEVPNYPEYRFDRVEPAVDGLTVNEDITITDYLLHIVYLRYNFPDFKGGYTSHPMYLYYGGIREDMELTRNDLPTFENYDGMIDFEVDIIDAYWDISDEDLALLPKSEERWVELYAYVLVRGDANGDTILNTKDAVMVLQYAVGIKTPEGNLIQSSDANRDGKIDTSDAVVMLKFAAGIIPSI